MKKSLEDICIKYGIRLRDQRGFLRNVIDVLEDIYLKCNAADLEDMMTDIYYEDNTNDVFQAERERGDWTV